MSQPELERFAADLTRDARLRAEIGHDRHLPAAVVIANRLGYGFTMRHGPM